MNNSYELIPRRDIWIVSQAQYGHFAIDHSIQGRTEAMGQEFRISSIGRYLLSPSPLNVQKRLVGCEIQEKASTMTRLKRKLFPDSTSVKANKPLSLSLQLPLFKAASSLATPSLGRHMQYLSEKLRPFDPLFQQLDAIDARKVAKVVGICEDDAGYRSPLIIDGSVSRQLEYIRQHVGHEVSVRLKRAYVANGLFEMKGFDFSKYDPGVGHKLIRFVRNGKPEACVLDPDNTIAFWVDDVNMIKYLQLLEYCIQQNKQMYESFYNCIKGKAVPIRLMFNHSISIDYTRAPLPTIFQKVIGQGPNADHSSRLVKQNLNAHQIGISFNCLAQQKTGENELCTDIAILQNLRALEPIKDHIPMLFEEMEKMAAGSDGEKFYLLEAIRGVNHDS